MSFVGSLSNRSNFLYTNRPERLNSEAPEEFIELSCKNINTLLSKMRMILKSMAYRLTALNRKIRFFESGIIVPEELNSTSGLSELACNEMDDDRSNGSFTEFLNPLST